MITALLLLPLVLGAAVEYGACRLPKRRFWRFLPPLLAAAAAAAAALLRYYGWSGGEERAPLSSLLLVPGIPGLAVLAGMFLGWRLWRYLWTPRVIGKKK